jgi:hypothetical protein
VALAAKRRVVVNAGRRRAKANRSRRRNLTPKQIKFFGTPAQKAALKNSRRRKANSSRARSTAQRSRSYLTRKHRTRSKNPGEILSLVLNPGGRKKGKKNMAAKSQKRSRAAKLAYRRRMRAKANPSHHRPRHRRRTIKANPRRAPRRSNYRRHRRKGNPSGGNGKFMQGVLFLVGGGVGFFGSKALTQMVMSSNNTGVTGYFGNAAATAAIAVVAHMLPPTRKFSPAIIAGGVLQIIYRVLTDNTQLGQVLSSTGMGDYQMQNFVTPQRLIDPLKSAQIEIPQGWGGAPPIAISTAAPPGTPHPAAMSGYNTQGFGHGMYSPQGLYS